MPIAPDRSYVLIRVKLDDIFVNCSYLPWVDKIHIGIILISFFCHLGDILKVFGHFLSNYLVFCKIANLLCANIWCFWQNFLVLKGQILKKCIWSHWLVIGDHLFDNIYCKYKRFRLLIYVRLIEGITLQNFTTVVTLKALQNSPTRSNRIQCSTSYSFYLLKLIILHITKIWINVNHGSNPILGIFKNPHLLIRKNEIKQVESVNGQFK